MANTDYIRNRTNDILRERIALGATQGGARRKRSASKCPKGKHPRKAYTVKRSCIKNRKKAPVRRRRGRKGGVLVGDGVHVGGSPFPVIDLISNLFTGQEPAEMGYRASGGARKRKVHHRKGGVRAGVYAGDHMMGYGEGEGCYMGACPNKSHMMGGARKKAKVSCRKQYTDCLDRRSSIHKSRWIDWVKYVQVRDGVSYKDAMQIASREWPH